MGTRAPTTMPEPGSGNWEPTSGRLPISITRSRLLRVELDDQLLLGGDRDTGPLRALEHATAERVAVHGDPRERRATSRLIHRGHDRRHLARLHAHAHFLAGIHEVARHVDGVLVDLDVTVA